MLVIKGFLVINSNVLFHCRPSSSSPPPFPFFLPVIITNIPGRCSGTHPIGLGTKAGERLLKTCQSYLTWISQVLYKAKASWAQEGRGWPGGHRHQHLPKAILQPGWGERVQSCHCIHASTVKGIGRAQTCGHGSPRSGFSVRKNNLIIFCFFFLSSISYISGQRERCRGKTQY